MLATIVFFDFAEWIYQLYPQAVKIVLRGGYKCSTHLPEHENSYLFSRMVHVWGWATWKRAWRHFDIEMNDWIKVKSRLKDSAPYGSMTERFLNALNRSYEHDLRAWGPKWAYSCLARDGLSIVPKVNLVYNIGLDSQAEHTKAGINPFAHIKQSEINFPLPHPYECKRAIDFDDHYSRYLFDESKKNQLHIKDTVTG